MSDTYQVARDAFKAQADANAEVGLYSTDRLDPLRAAVDAVLSLVLRHPGDGQGTCTNALRLQVDGELKELYNSWEYAYARADQCAMSGRDPRLEPFITLERELLAAKEMLTYVHLTLGRARALPKTRAACNG